MFFTAPGILPKVICMYLGITDPAEQLTTEKLFESNQQISLISDAQQRDKIKEYCDSNRIPAEYKKDDYYADYNVNRAFFPEEKASVIPEMGN